jgi:hypothetical protein
LTLQIITLNNEQIIITSNSFNYYFIIVNHQSVTSLFNFH